MGVLYTKVGISQRDRRSPEDFAALVTEYRSHAQGAIEVSLYLELGLGRKSGKSAKCL